MDLSAPDHIPERSEDATMEALAILPKAAGILLRVELQLLATPKPWPPNVVRARRLAAQAEGMLRHAFGKLDDGTRKATIATAAAKDPLGRSDTSRTDVRK